MVATIRESAAKPFKSCSNGSMENKKFCWLAVFLGFGILAAESASAKDFAFILTGYGHQAALRSHELMMPSAAAAICLGERGYDVRSLVGPNDPHGGPSADNARVFAEDYEFLKEQKVPYTAATVSNIKSQLSGLVADVKKARAKGEIANVEIVVNAHGHTNCAPLEGGTSGQTGTIAQKGPGLQGGGLGGGSGGGLPPSTGVLPVFPVRDCRHTIEIFDGDKPHIMETRDLLAYVEEMQKAGAHVNLNLNSCNAGASKDEFDRLEGVCTFYGTAENSFATGCHKGVPEDIQEGWWNSNTYVNMFRSCNQQFDALKAPRFKGYFGDNACFQGLDRHLKEKKIDLSSISSAYFDERKESSSFEASLLSCFEMKHLDQSDIGRVIYQNQIMCRPSVDENLKALIAKLEPAKQALIQGAWGEYDRAVERYNANITAQQDILPVDLPADSLGAGDARRLAALQQEVKKLSADVIAKERVLFQRYYELDPDKFRACREGACARPLGGSK